MNLFFIIVSIIVHKTHKLIIYLIVFQCLIPLHESWINKIQKNAWEKKRLKHIKEI